MDNVYNNIILKLDKMKSNIEKIKEYNSNNIHIDYINKLNLLSSDINTMLSTSEDLIDLYLENVSENRLSHEDYNRMNENKISKKTYNTFLPYMLYMQLLLKSNN
jgi:hypothetical protein